MSYDRVLLGCFVSLSLMISHAEGSAVEEPASAEGAVTAAFAVPLPVSAKTSLLAQEAGPHVYAESDYFVWGFSVIRWTDGKYHAYYSRWPRHTGFGGWLFDCEIAHAVADKPEGPFTHQGVVLSSRNADGWDLVNVHNPCVTVADGKICLYYISNNLKGTFEPDGEDPFPSDRWLRRNRIPGVRNSQCIGVAIADKPEGPFVRNPTPVVAPPHEAFINVAVNPAVTYVDGQYVMVMKGCDPSKPDKFFRAQFSGHAKRPEGPFDISNEPVYKERQSEDACIWYDETERLYHMTCHRDKVLAYFSSPDGDRWGPAEPPVLVRKEILLADGTVWHPDNFERPFVLTDEQGRPVMLYVAVTEDRKTKSGNIAIPLRMKE